MKTTFYTSVRILFCTITLLFPGIAIHAFDMNSLSPEERQQMEQFERELIEASKAIEEAVAQMSPEEQEEFNRAVEEMTKILEEMPDDEFDSFLEDLFSSEFDESMFEDLAGQMEEPQVEEAPAQKEIMVSLDEFKNTIALLDSLAKQLNALLVKISTSPDIPAKLVRWRDQDKIKYWANDISWAQLRTKIELLASTLLHMKKVDEKTKKALYLSFIQENKALIDTLTELNRQLIQVVPAIEIPEFGIEKLTSKSKGLLQKAMSIVTESLFITKLPETFAQIEEKFAPEAKKMAEEEARLEKEAGVRSARPVSPSRTIVAGKEETGYAISGMPTYERPGGSYPGSSSSSYRPAPSRGGQYSPVNGSREPQEEGAPGTPSKKGEKESKDKEKEKNAEEEQLAQASKELEDKQANEELEKIVNTVSELSTYIQENKALQKIAKNITNKPSQDDIAIISNNNTGEINKLVKDVNGSLDGLRTRLKGLTKKQKEYYQKLLQEKTAQTLPVFEHFVREIEKIKDIYETNKSEIDPEKLVYYLLDEETINQIKKELIKKPEELQQFENRISLQSSLFEIQDNIIIMLEKIKDLSYKPKIKEGLAQEKAQQEAEEKKAAKSKKGSEEEGEEVSAEKPSTGEEEEKPKLSSEEVAQIKEQISQLEQEKKELRNQIHEKYASESEKYVGTGIQPDVSTELQRIQEIDEEIKALQDLLPEEGSWWDWFNPSTWFGSSEVEKSEGEQIQSSFES